MIPVAGGAMSKHFLPLLLCLAFVAAAEPEAKEEKRPKPDPKLTPGQVVRIVMDALEKNDAKDTGIAVTFDFASPSNQKVTGPLERFARMVKGPVYGPMVNHKSVEYGKTILLEEGDAAAVVVTLVDANDEKVAYVFTLSRQTEGNLKDCWMTDGVTRVEPGEDVEKRLRDAAKAERA
jgi:hypothetical protein